MLRTAVRVAAVVAVMAGLPAAGGAAPASALFPYCWGGRGNDAVYYTQGLMLRQLVLYSNPSATEAVTGVRLVFEVPADAVEVVAAVMSDGYDRTKTDVARQVVARDGQRILRAACPMWDIKPGFTWRGSVPWSQWPGWWSALYVKGKKPGRYTLCWHLESDQGSEPENTAPLVVLPRPPAPLRVKAPAPGTGVGVWAYSLSHYRSFPAVIDGLAEALSASGVRRAYVVSDGKASVRVLRARGVEVALTNSWSYSYFAPKEPPEDARAVNEKGERIPGNSWCPSYVAARGPAWESALRPPVTEAIRASGADGYMLDYEGAAAQGYSPDAICFCERCRAEFARVAGGDQALAWPADVRPGAKWHRRWLAFRCRQGALYVKHIADMAREANPKARTYTWSGGFYKPYPEHSLYSQSCSDITQFAPYLTAPTVGTYVYPNDIAKALDRDPGFGTNPQSWGRALPDMIDVVRWTVQALPGKPVIPCASGGHTPGESATPLAGIDLLRYQIANHLLDGARGVDFWGTGPLEDGRYVAFLAWLSRLYTRAEPYLGGEARPVPGVETDAARWRAGVFRNKAGALVVLINGDAEPRRFRIPRPAASLRDLLTGRKAPVAGGQVEAVLEPFGVILLAGTQPSLALE